MDGRKILLVLALILVLKAGLGIFFLEATGGGVRAQEPSTGTSAPAQCPPELFEALRLERARLEERQKEILLREKRLKLLEAQVEKRLTALLELEDSLEKKLKRLETIENERFRLLVKAYSEMRPSKAAGLLMSMDPEMAVKILSAMKSDQVARILAAMPPEKAAPLAEALSGLPPKNF